jgi:hypothetical protein
VSTDEKPEAPDPTPPAQLALPAPPFRVLMADGVTERAAQFSIKDTNGRNYEIKRVDTIDGFKKALAVEGSWDLVFTSIYLRNIGTDWYNEMHSLLVEGYKLGKLRACVIFSPIPNDAKQLLRGLRESAVPVGWICPGYGREPQTHLLEKVD